MIVDTFENMGLYLGLHRAMPQVRGFLEEAASLPEGRYELDDGNFVIVREGETRESFGILFETHERYLELHAVVKGAERMEWAPRAFLLMTDPVNPVKDIGFLRGSGDGIDIIAGMFYFCFPQDAYKSSCHTQSIGSCDYRKYIFKLRVDQLIRQ